MAIQWSFLDVSLGVIWMFVRHQGILLQNAGNSTSNEQMFSS
jgi:hypothetical protein